MRYAVIFALLCGSLLAQSGHAPWPGQAGNTVGYAGYGALTSTTCSSLYGGTWNSAGGTSWATATTVKDCTNTGAVTISCNYCKFQRVDLNNGTGGTTISGSHIVFEGVRSQSNQVGFFNTHLTGSDVWLLYYSATPLASFYTAPPGTSVWPSLDASRTNSTTQTNGGTSVNGNDGYQYGILTTSATGSTYTYGADIWGFGNSFDIEGPPTGSTWLLNSWIHDAAYAATQGYHTDGPGYLNGTAAPSNVNIYGTVVASLGNTNGMAFQMATSGYVDMKSVDNYWSGFEETMSPGDIAPTHFTNSTLTNQFLGTDVKPSQGTFHGTTLGSNTLWACNQIVFAPSTTWTSGDGWTPTSGQNGEFWVLSSSAPASATDQGSNTICGSLSPSTGLFLDQPNNTTSASQTFTLKNNGSSTLTVTGTSMANGSVGFSIVGGTCQSGCALTTGQTGTIIAQFSPTALGPAIDQIQITDNMASPASPQLIPVMGISCVSGAGCTTSSETLTVTASGSGLVTDNFSEISCPPTCSASYATSTVVTLTAIANIGSYFSGWSGSGCSGAFRCTITMSAAESVTATFSTIPPNRTDLTPENTTTTPPASIGTGFSGSTALPATDTSLTSGNYGRCTDGNWLNPTTGATTNGYRFSSGCGDSAECRAWSIDHQLLAVQDQGGGTEPAIFLGPNVAGLVCQRIATTSSTWSSSHGVRLLDSGEFSPSNARWFYYKSGTVSGGTSGQISVMDLTNFANQSTNPPVTLVMDMANGFTPGYATGGTAGTITYNEFSGVEGDNTSSARLAMNFSNNTGGQGTGYLLIVATGNFAGIVAGSVAATTIVYTTFDFSTNTKYSTSWSGSAWVQTNVGSITGDQPGIHNARLNRNGNYVYITATTANCIGSCAGSFYNIAVTGATLFETCTISNPCGHQAQGYGVVFGNGGNRTYAYGVTLPTYTTIAGIPGNGGPVGLNNCSWTYPGYSNAGSCNIATNDSHMNTDADTNGLDTALVGITTTTNTGPEPPWDEVNIGPYRNELFFVSPTTGTVYRSGHTFDSTTSPTSGQYAIGVPSTDQQFVAQMTDWYGGFGKNDNTGTNSCVSATDYWRASNTYAANVNVWIKSSGQNPGNFIFNTGAGGTTSASLPAMNQTPGGTTTDGSVTWTNANVYSCRPDVVIIQTVLPSSLSFPTFSRSGVMLQ